MTNLYKFICYHCKQECESNNPIDHFPESTEEKVELCDDCFNELIGKPECPN